MNRSYWIFVQLSVVQPRATRKGGKVLQVFPSEEQNLSENVPNFFVQNTEDKNKVGGFSDTRTFKFKDATSNQSSRFSRRTMTGLPLCLCLNAERWVLWQRSCFHSSVGPRCRTKRGDHQSPDAWRITGLIPAAPAFEGEFVSRSCFSLNIFSTFLKRIFVWVHPLSKNSAFLSGGFLFCFLLTEVVSDMHLPFLTRGCSSLLKRQRPKHVSTCSRGSRF